MRYASYLIAAVCVATLTFTVSAGAASWTETYANAAALSKAGDWQKAFEEGKKAVDQATRKYGAANAKTALSFELLGEICEAQGRISQGIFYNNKALQIRRTADGKAHPNAIRSLTNIGDLYRIHGNYSQARSFYQEALDLVKAGGEGRAVYGAAALEGMAALHMQRNEYAKAEPLYQQALGLREILRKYNPGEDLAIARDLTCLAEIKKSSERYAEAADLYKRALAGYSHVGGPAALMTANTLRSLGDLYTEWGKPARALTYFHRALGAYERTGLPDNPLVGATLAGLANIYREQGKVAQAEALYEKALGIYERSAGFDKTIASRMLRNARIWPAGSGRQGI